MAIKAPKKDFLAVTSFMLRDHEKMAGMVKRFIQLKDSDPESSARVYSQFRQKLLRHMAWEEEVLFPMFEEKTGLSLFGPTFNMRAEHRQIRTMLDHLSAIMAEKQSKIDEMESGIIEKRLVEILGAHDEKEDQVFYPWIDTMIPDGEKQNLIMMMMANLSVPLEP